MGPIINPDDQKKLLLAMIVVGVFAVVLLALPVIIPLAGILVAIGVIIAAIYGIIKFLTK